MCQTKILRKQTNRFFLLPDNSPIHELGIPFVVGCFLIKLDNVKLQTIHPNTIKTKDMRLQKYQDPSMVLPSSSA